jgi:glycosyltransferase involved in cell wall biosynthesis
MRASGDFVFDVLFISLLARKLLNYRSSGGIVAQAVSSVLSQTYKNLELIIIGDCRIDNAAELLSQIDNPRLKFVNISKRKKRYSEH